MPPVFEAVAAIGRPLLALGGRGAPEPWPPKRVLVIRLDRIGDVVLTTPLLRALRRALPAAQISVLVQPACAPLLGACPYIDEVLTFQPVPARRRVPFNRLAETAAFGLGSIWRRRFDLALLPRPDVDHALGSLIAFAGGVPRRIGFESGDTAGTAALLTEAAPIPTGVHEVERSLTLIATFGGTIERRDLEMWTTADDEAAVTRLLHAPAIADAAEVVAVVPGAGHPKRIWPAASFAAAMTALARERSLAFVIVGGPGDRELADAIAHSTGAPTLDLTDRLTLRQVAALLRRCALTISNDTGPMHLSAAVGTPVVEISCHARTGDPNHENAPERFGPCGVAARVLRPAEPRPPCVDGCDANAAHCILDVPVESVVEAAQALLAPRAQGEMSHPEDHRVGS